MKCKTLRTLPNGYTIRTCEPVPSPGATLFAAFRPEGGTPAAILLAEPKAGGIVVASVQIRDVADYGKRLGTRLYEAAKDLACAKGKPLLSDHERSPFAESLWRKQVGKGRAMCLPEKGKGRYYANPVGPSLDTDAGRERADAIRRSLPKPATDGTYQWWPCRRYAVTQPCEVPTLEGVRPRRRKRRRK